MVVTTTELSGKIIGYDPGGNANHGVAVFEVDRGMIVGLSLRTVQTAEDVLVLALTVPELIGIGIDTLTCWGTADSGWRPADLWLRKKYREVYPSIVSPNGIFGSMALNGMAVLVSLRELFPSLAITETHPKVLYWALARTKYGYARDRVSMDSLLCQTLRLSVEPKNEHEWDAALSAFTAFQGLSGQWTNDLHRLPVKNGERLIEPCGPTNYWWPE